MTVERITWMQSIYCIAFPNFSCLCNTKLCIEKYMKIAQVYSREFTENEWASCVLPPACSIQHPSLHQSFYFQDWERIWSSLIWSDHLLSVTFEKSNFRYSADLILPNLSGLHIWHLLETQSLEDMYCKKILCHPTSPGRSCRITKINSTVHLTNVSVLDVSGN